MKTYKYCKSITRLIELLNSDIEVPIKLNDRYLWTSVFRYKFEGSFVYRLGPVEFLTEDQLRAKLRVRSFKFIDPEDYRGGE